MITQRLLIHKDFPQNEMIHAAAQCLFKGELVAFPTETVYGLGAIASDSRAVERIFAAKERPPVNPLIVHISEKEQAYPLVKAWSYDAEKLARTFWPGPLTLVLPAADSVPELVCGGSPGVGIRMPNHPVALALIAASAPLAAPSANRSGRPSPRTADEVWEDLAGRIPMLLDAGATPGGLESTVLDLTGEQPLIIRPGGVSREQIAACLGQEVNWSKEPGPADTLAHYRSSARVMVTTVAELEGLLTSLNRKNIALVANQIPQSAQELPPGSVYHLDKAGELFTLLRRAQKEERQALILVKDAGLPWDEAMEHRVQAAIRSSG